MRIRIVSFALLFLAGIVIISAPQALARGEVAVQRGAGPAAGQQIHANLLQVMRGILFPSSNVIFAAQDDPAAVEPDPIDPASTPNPLASVYGQWQAVENAGLAMAEAANLLTIPGRNCSNGRPVPVQNADWQKFVQGLRAAGMEAYKAAQSRDLDNILAAADSVVTACGNCHDVYREKTPEQGGPKNRCIAA